MRFYCFLFDFRGECCCSPLLIATWGSDHAQADINADGIVNVSDLTGLLAAWGDTFSSDLEGDVDGSCDVDSTDLDLVRATWGGDWAQADVSGDGTVNVQDLTSILANFGEVCE